MAKKSSPKGQSEHFHSELFYKFFLLPRFAHKLHGKPAVLLVFVPGEEDCVKDCYESVANPSEYLPDSSDYMTKAEGCVTNSCDFVSESHESIPVAQETAAGMCNFVTLTDRYVTEADESVPCSDDFDTEAEESVTDTDECIVHAHVVAPVGGDLDAKTIALGVGGDYNVGMMGTKRIVVGVMAACALCLGFGTLDLAGSEGSFETGVVIPSVQCQGAEGQSFSLYLPANYSREKAWPVLYAFDPAARGRIPVELFSRAAERYGYIVACSNNSRNGPQEPVMAAMNAIWHETNRLFTIDKRRVYVTGFSGGARVSTFFYNVVRNNVAGIIACGAGLSQLVTPERVKPSLYYGIVGTADFNYREMNHLDTLLDKAGVLHFIKVFEGPHVWPPEDLCLQAIQWMEVQAVKQKIEPADDGMLRDIFTEDLQRAKGLENEGKIVMAVSAYRGIQELFPGPSKEAGVEGAIARLEKTKYYRKFHKLEEGRNERELVIVRSFYQVLSVIHYSESATLDLKRLSFGLKIEGLKKSARDNDIYEQGFGKRQLHNLAVQARAEAGKLHQKGEYLKVVALYGIALEAGGDSPYRPYDYYNLACAHSRAGHKKKALKNLEFAVEAGFNQRETLEADPDLDAVRGEPGFVKITAKIKQDRAH